MTEPLDPRYDELEAELRGRTLTANEMANENGRLRALVAMRTEQRDKAEEKRDVLQARLDEARAERDAARSRRAADARVIEKLQARLDAVLAAVNTDRPSVIDMRAVWVVADEIRDRVIRAALTTETP
jgi:chromosome segregation ATPase